RNARTAITGITILPTSSCRASVARGVAWANTSRVTIDDSVSRIESIVDTAAAMIPTITITPRTVGTRSDARSIGVARSPLARPGNSIDAAKPQVTATRV